MESRVNFRETPLATSHYYPLTATLLTATTEGTAQTLGTVRADTLGLLERLAVSNQTGSAATLTVYFIPSGDTIGAANRQITALSIPANTNVDLTELVGGLYEGGTVVKAFAGTTSALIVSGYFKGQL